MGVGGGQDGKGGSLGTLVRTLHTSKPTGAVTAKKGREELTSWSYNEHFFVVAFYFKFFVFFF